MSERSGFQKEFKTLVKFFRHPLNKLDQTCLIYCPLKEGLRKYIYIYL